jgi:hypothetical protein
MSYFEQLTATMTVPSGPVFLSEKQVPGRSDYFAQVVVSNFRVDTASGGRRVLEPISRTTRMRTS